MRASHAWLGFVAGMALIHCGPSSFGPNDGGTDAGTDGGTDGGGLSDGGTMVPQRSITLTGQVREQLPELYFAPGLEGVRVRAAESSTLTYSGGFFHLEATVPDESFVVVHFEHEDYATGHVRLELGEATEYSVDGRLALFDLIRTKRFDSAQSFVVPALNGIGSDRMRVEIPAGALDPTREITVSVAYGDPTTFAGQGAFPGEFLGGDAGAAAETPIESVAFTAIELEDENGTRIDTLSEPATVALKLPAPYQVGGDRAGTYDTTTNNTIPWWSLDESSGLWVREDADPSTAAIDDAAVIEIDGTLYAQARATHFSWWNCDKPIETRACICADVVWHDGTPVQKAPIEARATTYSGYVARGLTSDLGRGCVTVQRSAGTTHRSMLAVRRGEMLFSYDVTDPGEGDVDFDTIDHPSYVGNTGDVSTCRYLANDIVVDFGGTVTGTVTHERTGSVASGYTVFTNLGTTTTTNAVGQYTFNGPVQRSFFVGADRALAQTVYILDAATPQVANLVILDQDPVVEDVLRSIDGPIQNGRTVTLTAVANDPDGATLSYLWTLEPAGQGSLGSPSGPSATWTAPTTGSGVDRVTLSVDDGFNEPTTFSVALLWGPENFTTRLSLTVENPYTLEPMPGVQVVVHRPHGTTIQASAVTDAAGQVNLGDLGRNRVSITFIYLRDFAGPVLYTFDDVPARENGVVRLYGPSGAGGSCTSHSYTVESIEADNVQIAPLEWNSRAVVGASSSTSLATCSGHLHPDGTISLLGLSYGDLNTISEFGAALDQTPGFASAVALNTAPLEIGVTTHLSATSSVSMVRNGVTYERFNRDETGTLVTRYLPPASLFPADTYGFTSTTSNRRPRFEAQRYFTSPPATVTMGLPELYMNAWDYRLARGRFEWGFQGAVARDFARLDLLIGQFGKEEVQWYVYTHATRSEWTFPDLPAPHANLVNHARLARRNHYVYADLDIWDYGPFSALDEFWIRLLSGNDLRSVRVGVDNRVAELYRNYVGYPPE